MTYIRSKAELARRAGVNIKTVDAWLRLPEFPARTAQGWPLGDFARFARRRLSDAVAAQRGQDADLRRAKLEKQCALLDVEIRRSEIGARMDQHRLDEEAGKVMSVEEHLKGLHTHATIVCAGLKEFVAFTTATFHDPSMTQEAERIRCKTLAVLKELVDNAPGPDQPQGGPTPPPPGRPA